MYFIHQLMKHSNCCEIVILQQNLIVKAFCSSLSDVGGVVLKKSVGMHPTKLAIFNSTSNSFLNQYLMKYSFSLHHK